MLVPRDYENTNDGRKNSACFLVCLFVFCSFWLSVKYVIVVALSVSVVSLSCMLHPAQDVLFFFPSELDQNLSCMNLSC